ncbi:predicted protein [Nematostella vectensis]|uniref:Endonuclease/exonuclease/phosphatase domain-containing protein n=1 Tax=Nematostella vectensis TaxID=45351 RepID=A7T299_NEMVE|nr:predicted protein [Nematostella vectensis]|eukprot:XP_001622016.1 hypothetical protein NEMVEDRAFT_v1g221280 [Nematostella vectensis]
MNVHGDPAAQDEDEARYANDLPEPWIIQERKRNSTDLMLIHLNINSCQNKLDELLLLNKELRSHVIFLTETKIDSSYTNDQLALEGYHIYRKDRKKGGGGLMAYFSSKMASRKVKLPKQYRLLEVLAINAIINNNNVLFVGIYRSPNPTGTDYYRKLEEELHAVCMWASMECNTLVLTGDLNLDRLRPERREGQILINLEEVFGLECLIKDPTRVTPTSETLLDVILTNKPELFRASGVLNPEMSDHHLVYGIMKERVSQHERKVVTFRRTGNSPADDDPLQDRNLMGNIQLDPVEPGAEDIPENTELERLRNQHKKELLIAHLNINSIQNKFEELCKIIKDLQIHVMFISETKIDSSYPDSQFSMAGYSLYRNDRKKGGGGIMALISTALVKKRLKINKNYKTVETLAFEIKTNKGHMLPSEGTGNSPADDDPLQDRNLMGNIQLDPVEPGAEDIPENTELERLRNQHKKELLIAHLNINSIQNKFEELCKIIKDLQIHVMFISETKIDSSYPDSQFSMAGYSLYRNDRKKGGGGIMALISTALVKKRLKINKNYKTVETLAFEIKTNKGNMVILGIYRPPTLLCGNYRLELENELSELCNWASLQANFVVVLGDLNLDRLKPEKPEGKLLLDLEAEQDFKCLITQPTRVEKRGDVITKTLIDVLLSNKPELFKCAGNYYPCLSDHALIYGVLKERINQNKPKVISFRSYKNFDADSYKKMLEMAPWHVGTGNSPADDYPLQDRNLMGNIQLDPVEPGAEDIPENTELERLRNQHKKELLIAHLNINSIQNKFEELCKIIKDLQIHVMFISETKIDSSYPDSQFSMAGYSLYRNDRKKGGGGIMALISTALVKKRLKINKNYKTVETLAFEIKTNKGNMVILGIYRPPTLLCGNYRLELENELSELCNWASLQANFVVVLGDLNLDRLKPEKPEGKLLLDLEAEQDFKCLITQPTRVEKRGDVITKTLIDVLLSNKPELFKCAGNYYPCLSDHALIYGVLKERINQNKPKVISFRSYKNFDADSYKKMLEMAPWHVGFGLPMFNGS